MTTVDEFVQPTFGAISVGYISQTGKAEIAPIVDADGKPIKTTWSRKPFLKTPWSVSSFDGGERCTLYISLSDELEKLALKVDAEVKAFIEKGADK